jgi:hypothetical protein
MKQPGSSDNPDEPLRSSRRILVLLAHPSLDRSEVNGPMAGAAHDIDRATLVDLYAEYPDFQIEIDREQTRLLAHDVIVFQHPLYWYSTPAILKEWQNLVPEHGFSYGSERTVLHGKISFNALTAGGLEAAYSGTKCFVSKCQNRPKPGDTRPGQVPGVNVFPVFISVSRPRGKPVLANPVPWRSIALRPARSAAFAPVKPRRKRPLWCGRGTEWTALRAGLR